MSAADQVFPAETAALAILVHRSGANPRFYNGRTKAGRLQTAWSLAGAKLFLGTDREEFVKATRLITAKNCTYTVRLVTLNAAAPAPVSLEPIADDSLQALLGGIGNELHNLGCEHQNDEALRHRLGELSSRLWTIAATPAPVSHLVGVLPPVVDGQMEIEPDVTAADLGVNAEPADDEISPYEQALRDAVEPFLDWLEMREEGAHIQEVRDGLIGVEDVLPDSLVVLAAHLRADKDQGVLTMGHFRKLQAAYDGKAALAAEGPQQ